MRTHWLILAACFAFVTGCVLVFRAVVWAVS